MAPPATFTERGPYAVGVTTRSLGDRDVEVWYPVDPELVDGQPTETFDALTAFPETLRAIVPLELSGEYDTLAFRDAAALPEAFPVLIYGHGFGGYRQIATHFTSHLASWGYVVVSADHLERGIAEQTLDLVGSGLFDESNSRPDAAVDDVRQHHRSTWSALDGGATRRRDGSRSARHKRSLSRRMGGRPVRRALSLIASMVGSASLEALAMDLHSPSPA